MIRVVSYLYLLLIPVNILLGQVKVEEIMISNLAIQLPGTLSYTSEKTPLLIWVHGSGSVDRDGNTPHYIKQFREAVNKENIAFFSYDKRTANPKNSLFLKDGIYFSDFVFDVQEVVDFFKKSKRFSNIVLVGHSQGSLVAMKVLKGVDKYISIAGAGQTIDAVLIRQLAKQNPSILEVAKQHIKELKTTGEIKNVSPNLEFLFAKVNQPFWLSWIKINPIEAIKKVTIPTLIINGDKDLQVLVSDAQALKKAKPDAKLVIIKNMNHLLKDIQQEEDNLKSYYTSNYPLSKQVISTIVNFVK